MVFVQNKKINEHGEFNYINTNLLVIKYYQ